MPRKTRETLTKRLKQASLDTFVTRSSSPILPSSPISPGPSRSQKAIRPKKAGTTKSRKKRATQKRLHSDDEGIPSADDGANTSSDPGKIRFEPQVVTVSSSEEEEVALRSPQVPSRSQVKKRKRRAGSDDDAEPVVVSSDEENIGVPVVWKGKGRETKRPRQVAGSDSDDEPQPRRLIRGVRPPTPEEDEDLMAEVDENRILDTRLRTRDKRSEYAKNLEKLKKRKRGEHVPSESSENEDEEAEEENYAEPFADARPDNGDASMNQEHEEMNSFIVEDDKEAVAVVLPAEFSMSTYQDLTQHFKVICQMFVHLAVQRKKNRRAFMEDSSKNEYFAVPLHIARRKLDGIRDTLASSVWRPGFKKSLARYPTFETVRLDFAVPGCDACHLGARLSTLVGRLSGKPYDRVTYKPAKHEEEDSDEEGEDGVKREFNLGRFCARRTRVYHQFLHWEYALFHRLLEEVDDLRARQKGERVFVRVAYAEGKKPPKDLTDADGITNWLDERGVMQQEWDTIKQMMQDAQNLDSGGKDDDDE